jgi:hypothetical protein
MDAVLSRVRAGDVDVEGVDPRLVPLLRASLSPDPSRRPHADEVIAALEQYAAGRAATVPTPHASWGAPTDVLGASPAPQGATQVFQDRGTAVLPPVPPTTDDVRWAPPPSGPRRRPEPEYDPTPGGDGTGATDLYDERYGHGPEPDEWDDEWGEEEPDQAPREGDPRIGMAMRTGVLGAAGIAWVGALMAWPGYAFVTLAVWSVLARATDRSVSALVFRRYAHGRRGSDIPLAVITSPWHLLVGAIATAVTLVLPIAVALAGIFATALLLAGATGADVRPGSPTTLAVGGLTGLAMLWWGPGGVSLRRGSRSIVRRAVPVGTASQVVAVTLVVAGLVIGLVAVDHGASLTWLPFGANPLAR